MDYNNNPLFSDKKYQLKEKFIGYSSFNKSQIPVNKSNKNNEKPFSFTNESFENKTLGKQYVSLSNNNQGEINFNRTQHSKSISSNKYNKNDKSNLDNQSKVNITRDEMICRIGKEYKDILQYTYDYEYNKYYSYKVVSNEGLNKNSINNNFNADLSNKNKQLKLVSVNYDIELDYSNLSDSFPDEFAEKYYKVPVKLGINLFFNPLRHCVSGGRIRFIDNDVDLDLSFITKKVIAMCYPSNNCLESLYRNPIKDLNLFFKNYLDNKVKVS
jgi:hypothetical protein